MKKSILENYRVVVEPARFYRFESDDDKKRTCEDIAEQIKRHVDGIDYVVAEWDTRYVCSHCGRNWEVDDLGVPVCCIEAQEEHSKEVE